MFFLKCNFTELNETGLDQTGFNQRVGWVNGSIVNPTIIYSDIELPQLKQQ